jgi:hypothetical protein
MLLPSRETESVGKRGWLVMARRGIALHGMVSLTMDCV